MSEINIDEVKIDGVKVENITPEQQKLINQAATSFFKKSLFNALNYLGLIILANIVAIMANLAYFKESELALIVMSASSDLILIISMMRERRTLIEDLRLEIKKITGA